MGSRRLRWDDTEYDLACLGGKMWKRKVSTKREWTVVIMEAKDPTWDVTTWSEPKL